MAKYKPKTVANKKNVVTFLKNVEHEQRRKDSLELLEIMKEVTGQKPVMWGDSIVGFGEYDYETKGCVGKWMAVAFSPRQASLVVYIMPGFKKYEALLEKLGPHKHTKSCLHIKRLNDINIPVLKKLIKSSFDEMMKKSSS